MAAGEQRIQESRRWNQESEGNLYWKRLDMLLLRNQEKCSNDQDLTNPSLGQLAKGMKTYDTVASWRMLNCKVIGNLICWLQTYLQETSVCLRFPMADG